MNTSVRKLRIGVTIGIRQGQQSVWENGIGQNCIYLAKLLQSSPAVETVVLVNASGLEGPSESMMIGEAGVHMVPLAEAAEVDVMIEMGAQLPDQWAADFQARGGKYVAMRVGNDYAIDIERAVFDKPPASLCTGKTFDVVWTIPGHEKVCADYFAITTRSPVRIVPHIWSPLFFQKKIDSLTDGLAYGYVPGRKHWRMCTFEPNINMVKTSMIPMLVCEEAYRIEPRFLEYYRICNTFQLKENPLLVKYANSLDIVTHGLTTFEGRFGLYEFLARQGDAVLSHQWGCPQNYVYYEALYGNYPLIHNSELLGDAGYYYPDCDAQEGGRVLVEAFLTHDSNLSEYNRKAAAAVRRVDAANPENIDTYTCELLRLYGVASGETLHLPDSRPPVPITGWTGRPGDVAEGITQARVINLDRRIDRMESFLAAHPGLADVVKRSPAVDGKKLRLTAHIARLFSPNTFGWKKPVVGCALSHLALWKELAEQGQSTDSWLILEDDARLAPDWKERWENALAAGSVPHDWDVIYLGGVLPPNRESFQKHTETVAPGIGRISPNTVFAQKPADRYFHFCAYAYLMTPAGARKVMERIRKHGGIWTPADHVICNRESDNLDVYFLDPLAAGCFQDDDPAYVTGNFNDQSAVGGFDSDLCNTTERFSEEEIRELLDKEAMHDISAALGEANAG